VSAKRSPKYFGQPIGNCQDPDEPYDTSKGTIHGTDHLIGGRGAQGGGSKPTPQRTRGAVGASALRGSYPKQSQKIRG